ncbi:DNA recombination protein RmuC [Candidatus Pantoea carbekii]|uniref:RmuC protein n=1 Tax=Candidatus Pantoea carbekii TaxID=1235990 RepID=U3U6V9_9GAMM|nr:DNA recombination protein RmuC [Candidatus Pantoea carbekii]AKC32263.1 putative DNA recombination protein RmuC [Candidatus Pantoea carbekii]BAN99973.1 RmuC protein [Candidatus Pantoea carbekii]
MDRVIIINSIFMLSGFAIGWVITKLRTSYKYTNFITEFRLLEEKKHHSQERADRLQYQLQKREAELQQVSSMLKVAQENLQYLDYWREKSEKLNDDLRNQLEVNSTQAAELREVIIRLEETRLAAEEKQRLLTNSEQRLSTQFENLANRIFENTGRRVDEQNRQSLHNLINPLREQLDGFHRHISDSFGQEARERYALTYEIRQLQQLNEQMTKEAINLTNALKGNNKIQGGWGEMVLDRVLQASGLREGYEYEIQVSVKVEQKGRIQPDVIVHLPKGKDVVIDAKMTLVAYERYFNTEDEFIREQAMQDHLHSVRNHIKLLGSKDYEKLPGINSLDYILMFIPIEPAFLLAINRQPELIAEAMKYNIMLVSPTTLMVALRTINNLWRYEHQNRNAQDIAERATKLYDKIRLFIDDMSTIGYNLDKAQQSYHMAMKKLIEGRGNLIAQIEAFRSLGVETKRPIDPKLVEQAQTEL